MKTLIEEINEHIGLAATKAKQLRDNSPKFMQDLIAKLEQDLWQLENYSSVLAYAMNPRPATSKSRVAAKPRKQRRR